MGHRLKAQVLTRVGRPLCLAHPHSGLFPTPPHPRLCPAPLALQQGLPLDTTGPHPLSLGPLPTSHPPWVSQITLKEAATDHPSPALDRCQLTLSVCLLLIPAPATGLAHSRRKDFIGCKHAPPPLVLLTFGRWEREGNSWWEPRKPGPWEGNESDGPASRWQGPEWLSFPLTSSHVTTVHEVGTITNSV